MTGTNETRIVNEATGGQKGSKDERYDLIPWVAMDEVARLYGAGAAKYDAHNWRKGYDWHLSYASMIRHAKAFWEGEDFDHDPSLPFPVHHLASVVFHALALITFRTEHPELDDRPQVLLSRAREAREATHAPAEAPEAATAPQGGAVAVFRHVSGPPVEGADENGRYRVRTGMEAPAGYRFSHIEGEEPVSNSDSDALLEQAWGIIANAYHGDWAVAPVEWQRAAAGWRDKVFAPACEEGEPDGHGQGADEIVNPKAKPVQRCGSCDQIMRLCTCW